MLSLLTSCEGIKSQNKEPDIERSPKFASAPDQIPCYMVINVRALQRAKSINRELRSIPKGIRYMNYLHPSAEIPLLWPQMDIDDLMNKHSDVSISAEMPLLWPLPMARSALEAMPFDGLRATAKFGQIERLF